MIKAGEVAVHCAHDAIVPLSKLKPNPQNPNGHPEEQVKLLAKIIQKTGWRQPITVSNRSGMIVKGHGRLLAAQYGNMGFAPVDYQDYDSDALEMADLLADNRLAELSEMNNTLLADMLEQLDTGEIDMLLTGYDEEAIQDLIESMTEEYGPDDDNKTMSPFCYAGDVWTLGTTVLQIGSDAEAMICDLLVSDYVYETGNVNITCLRNGMEHRYMEMLTVWAMQNDCEGDIFKAKKPVVKRR